MKRLLSSDDNYAAFWKSQEYIIFVIILFNLKYESKSGRSKNGEDILFFFGVNNDWNLEHFSYFN